jgi:hypothetical protein
VLHDVDGNILDENNTCELNQERLRVTWPKHLSELLGCTEFHNHSIGCGSNARIVRKTFDFFIPKILKNENISDFTVAIQWTEPSRFEFFDLDTQKWAIAKHDIVLFESNRSMGHSDKDDILHYYTYNNDKVWGSNFFNQIVNLGNFFKLYNIPYVFTVIHPSFLSVLTTEQFEYCGKNYTWYNNDINSCSISSMNVEQCELSPHPSLKGHKQIAENLHNFLRNHG